MKLFLFTLFLPFILLAQQIPVTTQQQVTLQNPLLNPGFENGTQGWSVANGAAMSADTTNALMGKTSLSFSLAATTNSGVESTLFTIPKAWHGQNCYMQLSYASVSALGAVPMVINQSNFIVFQTDGLPTGSGFYRREFTCPSSGSIKFRLNRSSNSPTGLIDNVEFGAKVPQMSMASYSQSNGQSFNSGSFLTVLFGEKIVDTDNVYNGATGVLTLPRDGVAWISATVNFSTAPTGQEVFLAIFKNGTAYKYGPQGPPPAYGASVGAFVSGSKGDQFTIRVQQTSGSSKTLSVVSAYNYMDFWMF